MKTKTTKHNGKPELWASELDRVAKCPASWRLSRTVLPGPDSPASIRGQRIHAALAGNPPPDLSPEENEQRENAWQSAYWLTAQLLGKHYSDLEVRREWSAVVHLDSAKIVGRYDILIWDQETKQACLYDWKTTAWYEWDPGTNWQLAAGALAAQEALGAEVVYVAIIETGRGQYRPDYYTYDEHGLSIARRQLKDVVDAAIHKPDRTRRGDHCRFCPALQICPETLKLPEFVGGKKSKELLKQYVEGLPPAKLADLLNEWKNWVQIVGKALEEEAKLRLSRGEEVPGWTLSAGTTVREVKDVAAVWRKLKMAGVSPVDFLNTVRVSIKDIERLLKPIAKDRAELKDLLEQVLEGAVEEKQRSPSLRREK